MLNSDTLKTCIFSHNKAIKLKSIKKEEREKTRYDFQTKNNCHRSIIN